MNLYAESSAVLSWLLDEPEGPAVAESLGSAGLVVTSDLTLVECARALLRAQTTGELSASQASDRRRILEEAAEAWSFVELNAQVLELARHPFPADPLRTLDALHLATALTTRFAVPGLRVLSLDRKVRESAAGLGFRVLPA